MPVYKREVQNCGRCPNMCYRYDIYWCHAMTKGDIHYHIPKIYEYWKDTPIPEWCPLNHQPQQTGNPDGGPLAKEKEE